MKKKNYSLNRTGFLSLFLMAVLMLSVPLKAADITTGLITHYSFDAVSGTTVPDDSGTGNAGTLLGAPTAIAGYSGNAMKFTTATDYMTLPSGIVSTLTDFTISTWVNITTLNTWSRIFDFGTGTSYYMFLCPRAASATGPLRFAFKNGGAEQVINGTSALPTGKWVHVAVTYSWNTSTSKGTGKLYVNGNLVGTNTAMTIYPALLPSTTQNYIAKSQFADPALAGSIDDFRIYSRALGATDVLTLAGTPSELISEYENLKATTLKADGDLTNVTSNLTLPSTLATPGVSISWASTLPATVGTDGTVTQPDKYDATVKLTATLTETVNGTVYTLTKDFIVTVKALSVAPDQLAQWNFGTSNIYVENGAVKVKDATGSAFVGTVMNEARIRTIGGATNGKINVLDLGSGTGYFDMGTEIGKAIYSLNNYTMCAFFRIDDTYTALNSNGNFIWNFSNSANVPVDQNGYIIGSLKAQAHSVTSNWYAAGEQNVGLNTNAAKGGWHHMAFTQNGNVATIFIDGAQVAQNTSMTNLPALALPKAGMTGTLYNWLGRSCYPTDVYLRQTLLYDFQLLSVPLTVDDLTTYISVADSITKLNNAYAENPDIILPELTTEQAALDLGDLSAVKTNLTLPSKGTLDNTISISWSSKNTALIANDGTVTRPNYYNCNDTLIATLTKNGQKVTKAFPATVIVKDGTTFTGNLLVKFDFATVSDSVVTDAAEKHFTATLKNKASIKTIGSTTKFNVLNLGDSINGTGYLDLGQEIGQVLYHQNDYTMTCYYRVNEAYTALASNGNFLWSFSNTNAALSNPSGGYLIASLKDQSVSITPGYYTAASGNQAVSFASAALTGGFHNLTYTQSGTIGTLYVDGMPVATGAITNLLSTALPKSGKMGTVYNWIGRSCYAADAYLRKTLVYDFRLYNKALTDAEIQTDVLNVGTVIGQLDQAYNESISGVQAIQNSPYIVIPTNGAIRISGLTGNEKVLVFDIMGRQMNVVNVNRITVNSGIYFVKVDNYVAKVIVR
jgi:hypothetical protein